MFSPPENYQEFVTWIQQKKENALIYRDSLDAEVGLSHQERMLRRYQTIEDLFVDQVTSYEQDSSGKVCAIKMVGCGEYSFRLLEGVQEAIHLFELHKLKWGPNPEALVNKYLETNPYAKPI